MQLLNNLLATFRRFTHITPLLVTILLAAMAWQLVTGAQADGVTVDEPIHLLSGYATLTEHHILFDPEHPFLIKAIAAVPLVWLNPTMPEQALNLSDEQRDVNYITYGEANRWGWELLFNEGNDTYKILLAARTMMIGLTLILGLVLFLWARQMFGVVAGLATLALFAFDPTILSHGHYINTDVGAALFFVATLASLWNFLHKRSWQWLIVTGVVLGFGLLSKFSLAMLGILLPLLVAVWLIYHGRQLNTVSLNGIRPIRWLLSWLPRLSIGQQVWLSYVLSVVVIGLLSLAVVWLGYGLLWLINPSDNPMHQAIFKHPAAAVLVIFPAMFAKGFANVMTPRDSYLLGQCYNGSRWDYFPSLFLFKMPLGSLTLLLMGTVSTVALIGKRLRFDRLSFAFWYLAIAIGSYLAFASLSGINIGIRHALPAYILLLVPAGYVAAMLWHKARRAPINLRRWQWLPVILIAWTAFSSLLVWPYYLPYYNELSGEPKNIPFISDDSNTDWGQGTRALSTYVKDKGIEFVAYDNFAGLAEARYLELPHRQAEPADHDYKGYMAISRSTMINHMCRQANDWGWVIDNYTPIDVVGGAVNVYLID